MNRSTIVKGLIGLTAATAALAAGAAQAQSYGGYNNGAYYDPCSRDRTSRSVVGGLLGGSVAGNGAKTEGAILGAGLGAVAGHQIAKNSVRCVDPPRRVAARYNNAGRNNNCRWVQEYYGGRNHEFEVCRNKDGVWRPSGRG